MSKRKAFLRDDSLPWAESDDYNDDSDELWDIAFPMELKPWRTKVTDPGPESILHSYTGNKRSLINLLGEVIPWITRLVEPFGGGASVALSFADRFAKRGWSQKFLCADRNPDIISLHQWTSDPDRMQIFESAARRVYAEAEQQFNFFQETMAIGKAPDNALDDVDDKCKEESDEDETPFGRTYKWIRSKQKVQSTKTSSWTKSGKIRLRTAEYAAIILWLHRNAFSSRLRYTPGTGKLSAAPGEMELAYPSRQLTEFMDTCSYGRIEFLNSDFRDIMTNHINDGDVIYCDPPYLDDVGRDSSTYFGSPFTLRDHEDIVELAMKCATSGVPVVISNFDNPTTRELYKNATLIYEGMSIRENMSLIKRKKRNELIATFMPPLYDVSETKPSGGEIFSRRKPYVPFDSDKHEHIL